MKRIQIKYIIPVLLLALGGCKKLDLVPTDRFTDANYWTSVEKASNVVNTAYNGMFGAEYFFYNEALSDNAYVGRGDQAGVFSISSGQYNPSLSRLNEEWDQHYAGIKTANVFLENVDRVPDMDETLKNRMKAEVRFIRAFHYFQLATWFGDVPFFTEDISIAESRSIERTDRQTVINFVLDELDAVAAILPAREEYADTDNGRITSGAAIALKARVLLYEGRWSEVITECEKLMTGNDYGSYDLFPTYQGLFLPENEYNQEVILDVGYVPLLRTYNWFFDFVPLSQGARLNAMAPTQSLVDNYLMLNGDSIRQTGSGYNEDDPYSDRDPRLSATVVYDQYRWKKPDGTYDTIYIKPGTDPDVSAQDEYKPGGAGSPTGYYLRKYYDPTSVNNFTSGLNVILIRYADVLLMYAEARNELGQFTATDWDNTIRRLRERAGFTASNALDFNSSWSQDELRQVIRRERRSELAMEGLRIFDVRRWKIAGDVLNGWVHGARFGDAATDDGYIRVNQRVFDPGKHYLWPIPRDERSLDPNLSQNDGWQ